MFGEKVNPFSIGKRLCGHNWWRSWPFLKESSVADYAVIQSISRNQFIILSKVSWGVHTRALRASMTSCTFSANQIPLEEGIYPRVLRSWILFLGQMQRVTLYDFERCICLMEEQICVWFSCPFRWKPPFFTTLVTSKEKVRIIQAMQNAISILFFAAFMEYSIGPGASMLTSWHLMC